MLLRKLFNFKIPARSLFPELFSEFFENINQNNKNLNLKLLAIDLLKNKGKFEINLIFNNNSCITLSTEIVEVTLEDQNKI